MSGGIEGSSIPGGGNLNPILGKEAGMGSLTLGGVLLLTILVWVPLQLWVPLSWLDRTMVVCFQFQLVVREWAGEERLSLASIVVILHIWWQLVLK